VLKLEQLKVARTELEKLKTLDAKRVVTMEGTAFVFFRLSVQRKTRSRRRCIC